MLEVGFLPLDLRFKGTLVQSEDQVPLLNVLSFLEEDAREFSCDLRLHGDGGEGLHGSDGLHVHRHVRLARRRPLTPRRAHPLSPAVAESAGSGLSEHAAGLHTQNGQGHFQFVESLPQFRVFPDFFLQGLQQRMRPRHMFGSLLKLGLVLRLHDAHTSLARL